MLGGLPGPSGRNVLVAGNTSDDAGVIRLTDDLALILTTDFFTPIVDDPFTFGRIAAANSLSDIYAMGGTPLSALNIVGFPEKTLPGSVLTEILKGGAQVAAEAGIDIVGGHTIKSEEPIYGLAVTGTVHPDRVISNAGARPGDRLVLTKPIGTGLVTTAFKNGKDSESAIGVTIETMASLNRAACEAMVAVDAAAATDITGFGLLGHLLNVLEASDVSAEVEWEKVPLLPGSMKYLDAGCICGGSRTNWNDLKVDVHLDGTDEKIGILLSDAQTSGGLLVAVPADREEELHRELAQRGVEGAATIGTILKPAGKKIRIF